MIVDEKDSRKPQIKQLNVIAINFVDSIIKEALEKLAQPDEYSQKQLTTQARIENSSIFYLACDFIDKILNECIERVNILRVLDIKRFQYYKIPDDFKVRDGLEIVTVIVSKWPLSLNWYFKISYKGKLVNHSTFYFYTVKWSIPSSAHPISLVTVDIYFTIEIFPNKISPLYFKVYYRMETDRAERCAFTTPFLEKWLRVVFQRKLEIFTLFKL